MSEKNDKPEKKTETEKMVGATVLYKLEDGTIRAGTITSVSPSKKFLHCSDTNLWLDPAQIVDTISEPSPATLSL